MKTLPLREIRLRLMQIAPNIKGLTKLRESEYAIKSIVDDFAIDGEAFHVVLGDYRGHSKRAVKRLADDSIYTF